MSNVCEMHVCDHTGKQTSEGFVYRQFSPKEQRMTGNLVIYVHSSIIQKQFRTNTNAILTRYKQMIDDKTSVYFYTPFCPCWESKEEVTCAQVQNLKVR